jgi:solute carrier family 25 protein 38
VKTRIEGSSSSSSPYKHISQTFISIFRADGIGGLYAGVLPSILKDAPFAGIYLALYSNLKTQFTKLTMARGEHTSSPSSSTTSYLPPLIQFTSAFISGI